METQSQKSANLQVCLHHAARRYCMERHAYWCKEYDRVRTAGRNDVSGRYEYSEQDLRTFPRHNVLNAILQELERIDPLRLSSLSEARELFAIAGETAESIFTRPPYLPFVEETMFEERKVFSEFVRNISETELQRVSPVFFRRILSSSESQTVRRELKNRWKVTGAYWYPLSQDRPPDAVAFDAIAFDECVSLDDLRSEIARQGVDRLFELQEIGGIDYEMELSVFEPVYGSGGEAFWCSNKFDWLVYASHETSVTIAGAWLLERLKAIWPGWSKAIWALECDLPRTRSSQ